MNRSIAAIAAGALALGAAACGDDNSSADEDAAATTATVATSTQSEDTGRTAQSRKRRGKRIKLRNSQFGRVLFDSNNRAIYLFTREPGSRSRCYGSCAAAWPPVLTRGRPRAGSGIDADLLGTTRRRDGRRQVTYNRHPLYYYVDDPRGQVLCHNVVEFGGTWLVLNAAGDALS
jgi:predicted lipoprotein with Yx(FWY)xxD motif